MSQKGIVFRTQKDTRELAHTFREAALGARSVSAKLVGFQNRTTGRGPADDFYTPRFESPFDAVDGVPDFAIGYTVLKHLNSSSKPGNGTPIHLYVFDEGQVRQVELVSAHGLTGGPRSARIVRKTFEVFRLADPDLEVVDENVLKETSA